MADNVVNVLDFKNFIRQFMSEQIKKTQPDMDTGENSSFDDIFVKPMVAIVEQIMQSVSLIEYRTNLKYADMLTDDQLNDIGENNYAVARKSGNVSSAVQVFKFSNVGVDGITIPAGVVVTSNDGYEFYTRSETYFTNAEVLNNYNPLSGQYELSTIVYAAKTGSEYNKGANTINVCQTSFNQYLVSTTNPSAAAGGTDTESVAAYAERMKTYYASQHLGSKPGYEAFISNAFPTLSDIVVIGYGDEAMQRDIIKYIPSSCVNEDGKTLIDGWSYHEKHIGGCVDIYVKGSEYKLVDTNVVSESRYLLVDGEVASAEAKDSAGKNYEVQIVNIPDSESYSEALRGKSAIIIGNESDFSSPAMVTVVLNYSDGTPSVTADYLVNLSLSTNVPSPISQKVVAATYTNATGEVWDTVTYEQWKAIIGADMNTAAHEDCEIIRHTIGGIKIDGDSDLDKYYIGSTQEQAAIILSPYFPNTYTEDSSQPNTSGNIVVTTSYNVTLNDISSLLNLTGNRIVTGDVLVKEAESVKVNVAIEVRLLDSESISELRKSQIHSVVSALFDATPIGGTIEQSDIVGELYSNSNTKNYIKYIRLPLKKFYCAGNNIISCSEDVVVESIMENDKEKKILRFTESVGTIEVDKNRSVVGLSIVDKLTGSTISYENVTVSEDAKSAVIEISSTIATGSEYTVKYNALYDGSLYENEDANVVMPDYISAQEDKYLSLDEFSVTVI